MSGNIRTTLFAEQVGLAGDSTVRLETRQRVGFEAP